MVNRTSKCFGFFVSILILLVPYSSQSQGVNPNTPDQIRRAYDKAFETMFKDPGNLEKTFSIEVVDNGIGMEKEEISELIKDGVIVSDPTLRNSSHE